MLDRSVSETEITALLVEDSAMQRAVLANQLSSLGLRVIEAASGGDAEARLAEFAPDVIVLDWGLPDTEGVRLVERWSRDDRLGAVPIILITAAEDDSRVREALDAGAVDFARKSPNPIELQARVKNALKLKRLHDELRWLARHDSLTRLLNRRALTELLRRELLRAQRYQRAFSIALVDVDRFKHINDAFGHDAGDRVLVELADCLARSLRPSDAMARYGGDEFVVLMPETAATAAASAMERLRASVAAEVTDGGAPPRPVTVSIGVAEWQDGESSVDGLLARADQRLYAAKNGGRDCVAAE